MSDKPLHVLLEELPSSSMTTRMLGGLDYIVPGEWTNITNFAETIRAVTGESDESLLQQIGERAIVLYADESNGYQRAVSIYQLVDSGSTMAGVTSLAAKLAEDVSWLNFLGSVTPKPETSQAIDAALKFAAEIAAFCCSNGMPGDGVVDFVKALTAYEKEDKIRFASWVAVDCLLPLGPDFLSLLIGALDGAMDKFEASPLYGKLHGFLPGGGAGDKSAFLRDALGQSSSHISNFVAEKNLSQGGILETVKGYVDGVEGKLDYVASIIDLSTNVFEHTGIQSVARRVIKRAYAEI
jgi:hypothetical protein